MFLGQKIITIQYSDKQGALNFFQKYRLCEDYKNLFWTKMFLLELLEKVYVSVHVSVESLEHFHV